MYSSVNDKSQTMKSSACGPTSASIIVSSSKGAILPTTLAKLSVDNGFRTASSGTAWSFYPFIADYFDFEEYYTTNDFDTAMNYLKQKESNGDSKYYIIASCGSGLFTTSGHYICLMGLDNNIITVYDPYIYNGKFNTASRKNANVKVDGNIAYVTRENFKKYANYKSFWIFSNDQGEGNPTEVKKANTTTNTTTKTYTRYVKVSSSLNVRSGAGTNYKKVSSLNNGDKVTVYETKNGFSRVGENQWVSSQYLSETKPNTTTTIKNTIGQYKVLKVKATLYSKSNLSGTKYNYVANTKVKIIKNISSTVDYVYVVKTKRYAYVKNNVYK